MPTNYEAIGRCKKLQEEIEALSSKRNQAIMELRRQLHGTMGGSAPRNVVYTFDAEKANATIKALEAANVELMEAVSEFNEYATEGEQQPFQIKAPRE